MEAGCDPLIWPFVAIHDCPDEIFRVTLDYLQIRAEGFEPMTTPNIEVR